MTFDETVVLHRVESFTGLKSKTWISGRSASESHHLTQSIYKFVLQKLIPAQIHQPILFMSYDEGYVHRCVQKLTSAKRLYQYTVSDKVCCLLNHVLPKHVAVNDL